MTRGFLLKTRHLTDFFRNLALLGPSLRKFRDDNGFFLSSGIAFNILINLIPLILLLSALIATYLYNDREVLDHIRSYLRGVAPTLDSRIIQDLMDIIETRQMVGILGFVGLVWFSTFVFGSLQVALDIVFRVEKSRGLLHGIGIDLLMIVFAGSLFATGMILGSVVSILRSYDGRAAVEIGPSVHWMVTYVVPFFLVCCSFFLIYKVVPNKRLHFSSVFQAAFITGLSWEVAKHIFSWYIGRVADYSIFYGSLSALAIFVVWVYYSSMILVLGGEFAYFLEEHRRNDTA